LQTENKPTNDIDTGKPIEQNDLIYPPQQSSNRSSIPMIAGIMLLVAGIFSILFWIQFFSLDVTTLESYVNISQFKQIDSSMTPEKIIGFLNTCATIGCIIAVFPILGTILALKRKLWGVTLTCSIIGIFSFGMLFTLSILSFIAMILLIFSRKEFQ